MSWLYFTLLTVLLWGVGQVFIKKGFLSLSPFWTAIVSCIANILVYIPFSLANHASTSISLPSFFLTYIITTLLIFFFYAIEKGQLSFSGTIFATYPITTVLLSRVFLNESISPMQYFMIIVILTGCVLLSYTAGQRNAKIKYSWVAWAILGAATTGAADFLTKIVLNNTPLQTYNFYFPITYCLSILTLSLFDRKGRSLKTKIISKRSLPTLTGILMLTVGLLVFNYSVSL